MPNLTYTLIFSSLIWPVMRSWTRMLAELAPSLYPPYEILVMTLEYHFRWAWLAVTNPAMTRLFTCRQSWLAHVAMWVMMSASLRLFRRGWWQMGHSRISTTCSSPLLTLRSSRSKISPSSPGVLSSGTEMVGGPFGGDSLDDSLRLVELALWPGAAPPGPRAGRGRRFLTLSTSGSMPLTRSVTVGFDLASS